MVGLPLLLLLLTQAQAEDSCSVFRREYCNLRLDKILMLDTALTSPSQCQVRDELGTEFYLNITRQPEYI